MTKFWFIIFLLLGTMAQTKAQTGVDTLHYRKVYYFGGTGIAMPIGKTKDVLSSKLFTGSMGLDISLKNPNYFLLPTLFTMLFNYDQQIEDENYNRIIENGKASIFALSLAGGARKQFDRLNTYTYVGPAFCLDVEDRIQDQGNGRSRMESLYSFSPAMKLGVGADYKFSGFFLGLELGYMHHFRNIQGAPVNVMTLTVGLKSDITRFSGKVVDVISKVKKE